VLGTGEETERVGGQLVVPPVRRLADVYRLLAPLRALAPAPAVEVDGAELLERVGVGVGVNAWVGGGQDPLDRELAAVDALRPPLDRACVGRAVNGCVVSQRKVRSTNVLTDV
jgi:hypothetical protein